ncbi:MAG: DUF2326 domain-containing protein [Nitrospira sp.]|nr:DUF2326 domain-containing protein [Nitrospira sp.]
MFLKKLLIQKNETIIRDIRFHKGINLIVDETKTEDKKESGNNVGKSTVLRLVDYCLGGNGKNIYQDPEFKSKTNTEVEDFLKNSNIIITLILKKDLDDEESPEIEIRRNFLKYGSKIQEIDGEKYTDKDFTRMLKQLIFHSKTDKPTFRQIISKNIRDEKNRLQNTVKVLHATTTDQEYEALYLFWFGIDLNVSERKQKLVTRRKIEDTLQKRLKAEGTLSSVIQSLIVVNRMIQDVNRRKETFVVNENYEVDIASFNQVKADLNKLSTRLARLELRRELIRESIDELALEVSNIDVEKIRALYDEAKVLIPKLQKTFEDTMFFHNAMVQEKKRFISNELPQLDSTINELQSSIGALLDEEERLASVLKATGAKESFQSIIDELSQLSARQGSLLEQKRLWESTLETTDSIEKEIEEIDKGISSLDETLQERVSEFNKYFSSISSRLYGEQFVLSPDKTERGYQLNISSISGNLGTGKKKGQMAAFDLAYIQYADQASIDCLHFILQDQIENVHDNQISSLMTKVVSELDCQYVMSVLRDKLPTDIDIGRYTIVSLSQDDKLFRI